ncbi:MAG: DUF1697 domain-containing protein [Winogradskyella sp.]|uniref:DUF1697 domain-containing protein n=1 Tax=Winogradskyella sp. TaxID=1883156 RepID=UPI00179B4D6A|nr:DUF1697 domain-containing protein [Winogradskyella sp.]
MNTYIALLRGINVGGHKKIPMAALRDLLTAAGLVNVKTYIQSGNVIFQSSSKSKVNLETLIKTTIKNGFDFDVPVQVKQPSEIRSIIEGCPFSTDIITSSYFMLLNQGPEKGLLYELQQEKNDEEPFVILNNCIYIHYEHGAGKSKRGVNWFEKKLKVDATARNYRTMVKLLSLSENLQK